MTFISQTWAEQILNLYHIITDMNTDTVYIYNKNLGYYDSTNAIPILKQECQRLLDAFTDDKKVKEIISYVKRETYRNVTRFDPSSEYVCLNNGILNIKKMELEKFTPDKFVAYRIPVTYDPKVDGELWQKYVESTTKGDDALTLQESTGNIFANHYLTKKLTYIYGTNDSGKSTFFDIIQNFLTRPNYSSLSLSDLCEKFTNASIYGKRVNIHADIPYKISLRHYGIIKNFTGNDEITLQFKNKDAFQYTSIAKLFFSGNGIPAINQDEADDAFYRRWQFIKFPHQFEPNDEIEWMYSTHEMQSAILNWALAGYKRLKEQKWKLTNQTSIDDVRDLFDGAHYVLNDFELWLTERCIPSLEFELKPTLFRDCRDWSIKHNKKVERDYPVFCKNLARQKIIKVEDYDPTVNGEKVHAFRGIQLKDKGPED